MNEMPLLITTSKTTG